MSLEDAAKPLVAHGVTAQVLPQVCYTIDNMDPAYHGRPVWLFSCEERREDASDLYYAFIVDGLTGALLEIHDAAGNKLSAEGLEALRWAATARRCDSTASWSCSWREIPYSRRRFSAVSIMPPGTG